MNPAVETDAVGALIADALRAWRPPPRLKLSEWADANFYLSPESAADPGRWKTLPYQREILDAFTDPTIERVYVMKSARIGWTKCMNALIAYCMAADPCPIMIIQPTIEDAEGYSREEIAPMIRDVPVLSALIPDSKTRDSGQTILHKSFPGGSLSMVGANSGRGFRRVSRKVVLFDEVDGYPPSAGTEGDQISLGIRRTEYYWDRKIGAGSTPSIAGRSRIAEMFESGDQRRFYVPCPTCGHMDFLVFREADRGHFMQWPDDKPEAAYFVCRKNGCVIEHNQKRAMVTAGEWRADRPGGRIASFHCWAAYSFSPNATWGQIACEFIEASKRGAEQLKTFINTVLGEVWQDRGDAPDWKRLYQRREDYEIAVAPIGVTFLTAGVDVQRDRLVWEVVGWGDDRQSWSIDAGVIPGDTSTEEPWSKLDELLDRQWPGADGSALTILMMGIDSGYNTQIVYSWARRHPLSRVIAIKGTSTAKTLITSPSAVDVTVRGKRLARGYKVWPIGVDIAKSEFYGWLRLEIPSTESGDPFPPGFCHFPEYGEEYFKQITAEQIVPITSRKGFTALEWQLIPGRQNHWLDCRVYARAAAAVVGLDRLAAAKRVRPPQKTQASAKPPPIAAEPQQEAPARSGGTWLGDRRMVKGGGWLKRR